MGIEVIIQRTQTAFFEICDDDVRDGCVDEMSDTELINLAFEMAEFYPESWDTVDSDGEIL